MKKPQENNLNFSRRGSHTERTPSEPINKNNLTISTLTSKRATSYTLPFKQSDCNLEYLQKKIRSRLLMNQHWRSYGLQLSFEYSDHQTSLLQNIMQLKIKALLSDIHELIFKDQHHYQAIFKILRDLMEEYNMENISDDWMNNPILMILGCIQEHARQREQNPSLEYLFSICKTL